MYTRTPLRKVALLVVLLAAVTAIPLGRFPLLPPSAAATPLVSGGIGEESYRDETEGGHDDDRVGYGTAQVHREGPGVGGSFYPSAISLRNRRRATVSRRPRKHGRRPVAWREGEGRGRQEAEGYAGGIRGRVVPAGWWCFNCHSEVCAYHLACLSCGEPYEGSTIEIERCGRCWRWWRAGERDACPRCGGAGKPVTVAAALEVAE